MTAGAEGSAGSAGAAGEPLWADAAEHVAVYRRTDGARGHLWHGRPHLLLTTTGRRSGRPRTVPLVYARLRLPAGERLVVVASAGGAERHPDWYLNTVDDPAVTVRLLHLRWATTAVTAAGSEEDAAWEVVVRTWDGFERYRRETARRIPVLLLGTPPGGVPPEVPVTPRAARPDALP